MEIKYSNGSFTIRNNKIILYKYLNAYTSNYIVIDNTVIFYGCDDYSYDDIKKACNQDGLFKTHNIMYSRGWCLKTALIDIPNILVNYEEKIYDISKLSTKYLEKILADYNQKSDYDNRYYEIISELRCRKLKIIKDL